MANNGPMNDPFAGGYTGYLGPQRYDPKDGHPMNVLIKNPLSLTERDIECLGCVNLINWYIGHISSWAAGRVPADLTAEELAQRELLFKQKPFAVATQAITTQAITELKNSMTLHE